MRCLPVLIVAVQPKNQYVCARVCKQEQDQTFNQVTFFLKPLAPPKQSQKHICHMRTNRNQDT